MFRKLFTFRWILTSIFVLIGLVGLIRLGFWQLDRLDQRKQFNTNVYANLDLPILDLNQEYSSTNLAYMMYRSVVVKGEYLPDEQIVLRNEVYENLAGFHLLTPLRISGTNRIVLVDRGWIPLSEAEPASWSKYDQSGEVVVQGVIRISEPQARFGPQDGQHAGRQISWNRITLELIQSQLDLSLLPVFIQMTPDSTVPTTAPIPSEVSLDLSEGSHLSYALQWFTFALILAIGYPVYLRKQLVEHPSKLLVENLDEHSEKAAPEVKYDHS